MAHAMIIRTPNPAREFFGDERTDDAGVRFAHLIASLHPIGTFQWAEEPFGSENVDPVSTAYMVGALTALAPVVPLAVGWTHDNSAARKVAEAACLMATFRLDGRMAPTILDGKDGAEETILHVVTPGNVEVTIVRYPSFRFEARIEFNRDSKDLFSALCACADSTACDWIEMEKA